VQQRTAAAGGAEQGGTGGHRSQGRLQAPQGVDAGAGQAGGAGRLGGTAVEVTGGTAVGTGVPGTGVPGTGVPGTGVPVAGVPVAGVPVVPGATNGSRLLSDEVPAEAVMTAACTDELPPLVASGSGAAPVVLVVGSAAVAGVGAVVGGVTGTAGVGSVKVWMAVATTRSDGAVAARSGASTT
jgi:hypothetical protein